MSSVTNLLPKTRAVALGGAAVLVTGLSLRKLTELVMQYPELLGFVVGNQVEVAVLIGKGPEIALAIFAVGYVGPVPRRWWQRSVTVAAEAGNDLLAVFDDAPAGQQIDAVSAIIDLTFKGERVAPFLAMLASATVTRPEPAPEPVATSETPMPDSSSS